MLSLELETYSTHKGGGRTRSTWFLRSGKNEGARSLGRGPTRWLATWDAMRGIIACWRGRHEVSRWRHNGGPPQITCSRCGKGLSEESDV